MKLYVTTGYKALKLFIMNKGLSGLYVIFYKFYWYNLQNYFGLKVLKYIREVMRDKFRFGIIDYISMSISICTYMCMRVCTHTLLLKGFGVKSFPLE